MTDDDHSFVDEALRDLARSIEADLQDHPDPDVLLAHGRGELPPEEAAVVEDHVLWCRDCASFERGVGLPDAGASESSAAEKDEDWQVLRHALEEVDGPRSDPAAGGREATPAVGARYPVARAAAAVIAVAAAGIWIGYLVGDRGPSLAPEPNVAIRDLVPPGAARVGETEAPTIDATGYTVLLLNTRFAADAEGAATYDARFVGEGGETALAVSGLRLTEYGNLSIGLPPGALASGSYSIEVTASDGEAPLATFPVVVRDAPH